MSKINKSQPWAFFDRASQGNPLLGGEGGIIYLSKNNKIAIKISMGQEINSKAELSALWTVLKIAKDKQVPRIHIFGD